MSVITHILVLLALTTCLGVNASSYYKSVNGCYNLLALGLSTSAGFNISSVYECYLIAAGSDSSYFGILSGKRCLYNPDLSYISSGLNVSDELCNAACKSGESLCGGTSYLSIYEILSNLPISYYWPFDSPNVGNVIGTNTNDIGCNNFPCTEFGIDRFGSDNGALWLNTNQAMMPIDQLNTNFTITMWINKNDTNNQTQIIDCNNAASGDQLTIYMTEDNAVTVNLNTGSMNTAYTSYQGIWYHIALAVNGINGSLYINGEFVNYRGNLGAGYNLNLGNCSLGSLSNGSFQSNILLDDIKIFSQALTQQEIMADMDLPASNNVSSLSLGSSIGVGLSGFVQLYNTSTGSSLNILSTGCFGQIKSLIVVNSSTIAGSCSNRFLYFWDTQFNIKGKLNTNQTSGIENVFMVSSTLIATRSILGRIRLWDLRTNAMVALLDGLSVGYAVFTEGRFCYWNSSMIYIYPNQNNGLQLPVAPNIIIQLSDKLMAYSNGPTITICLISNASSLQSQTFDDTVSSIQVYSEQILVGIDASGYLESWNWQTGVSNRLGTGLSFTGATAELFITSSSYIIGIINTILVQPNIVCWQMNSNMTMSQIWSTGNVLAPRSLMDYNSNFMNPKVYVYQKDNYLNGLDQVVVVKSSLTNFTVSVLFFSSVDYTIAYQWSITKFSGGTTSSFQTENPTRVKSTLVLPRNALDYGVYQVLISVKISMPSPSKDLTVSKSFNLTIIPTGITVMALPNNLKSLLVGKAQDLTLSPAQYSIDSDQLINMSSLSFKFYCHLVNQTLTGQNYLLFNATTNFDLATSLDTNSCFNNSGSYELRSLNNELYIKPGSFQNLTGQNYQFIVTTTTSYGTYYQILNVYGADRDQVIQPVINPRLSTLLVPYLTKLTVSGSNDLILQGTYLGTASIGSSLSYYWKISGLKNGVWVPTSTAFMTSYVSGRDTNEITIKSGFFVNQFDTQSWKVVLILNQTISSLVYSSSTFTILELNSVPYNGTCQVSSSSGTALTTLFTISCQDWTDSDGIVADYAFYASDEERTVSLGRDSSGSVTMYLPVSSSLSLFVLVYDDMNGMSVYPIPTWIPVAASNSTTVLQTQQNLLALATSGSQDLLYSSLTDLSNFIISYTTSVNQLTGQLNESNVQQQINKYLVNQISMFNVSDVGSIESASSALSLITSNTEMFDSQTAVKIVQLCNQMATNLIQSGETSELSQLTTAINSIFDASTNSLAAVNADDDLSDSVVSERETLNSLTNFVAYRLSVGSSFSMSSESMDMLITRSRLNLASTSISLKESQMTFNNACQLINQSDCSTAILITQAYARSDSLNLFPSLTTQGSRSISVSFFDDEMSSIDVNDYPGGFDFWIKRDASSSQSFVPFNTTQKTIGVRNQLQSFLLEVNTNASVTIEINPNDTAYLIGVKYGQSLVINSSVQIYDLFRVFCTPDLTSEAGASFYRLFASNPNYASKIGYGLRELTDDETVLYCSTSPRTQPTTPPVLRDDYDFSSLISSSFSVRVYASSCYFVDELKNNYSSWGTQVLEDSNTTFTHCLSTHLTEFAGGLVVLPSTIDFNNVWSKADFTQNLTIYLTVIIISSLYILMFVWCRYMDWTDEKKRAVYFLDDNSPLDKYFYEIIVFTGQRRNAGTKSKVSFVMGGMDSDSPVRSLEVKKHRILERGSVNSFIMSTEESIGDLNYIKIWHDNSGKDRYASWFLKFLIVHDLQTRDKFYFICNDWLAVDKSDGQLERFLPVAMGKQKTELKYLMEKQTKERLSDGHLWYSILARPSESSFSRSDRLTCAFVLLCLTMLMNIMYYDVAKSSSSSTNELVIGPFALSQTQIVIGVITNLVIFPPSFLLLQMFRRSRRRTTRTMKLRKQIEDIKVKNSLGQPEVTANTNMGQENANVKLSKPKRRFTLPWWFKIISYLLSAAIVAVCLFFVLVKGISFGDDQCRRWLTSFLISILTSIFLTQPLQILLISVFIIILFRQDDDSNDTEYDPNDDGQPINKIYTPKSASKSDTQMLVRYDEQNEILLAQLKKKRDQEAKAWSIIKKTVIYAIFLTVLFQNITRVKTAEQVFDWIYDEFAPAVFRTDWYNSQATTGMSKYITDYTSVLVGNILLRQARVVTKTCSNTKNKLVEKNLCYYDYSVSNYDHKDYGVQWTDAGSSSSSSLDQSVKDAFTYSSASSIDSKPYSGRYTDYLGGGYVFQMDKTTTSLTQIRQRLSDLETNCWVNQNTRAVFLEFTVYNVNLDLFSYCVILFEFLPTGSIVSSFMFEPISLYADESILILVFDIVYLFIMVFFVLKEIKLMVKLGLSRYLSHWWSYLDWTLIAFSFTAFAMYLCRLYEKWGVSGKIKSSNGQVINFQTLNYWNGLMLVFLGFCCFAASLKLIKIFEFSRTIKMLMRVFRQCFKEMCYFIIIYLILLLAFTQLMYLMVYDRNVQFQSFAISLVTGFLIMIGKFNVDSFSHDAGVILGPVVYSMFVVTMVMVLLNMFITVITDSFSNIRKEMMELHGREDSLMIMFFNKKVVQPIKSALRTKKSASLKKTDSGDYKDTLHSLEQKSMRLAHHINVNAKDD